MVIMFMSSAYLIRFNLSQLKALKMARFPWDILWWQ